MEKIAVTFCLLVFVAGYLVVASRRSSLRTAVLTLTTSALMIACSFYLAINATRFTADSLGPLLAAGVLGIVVLSLMVGINTVLTLRPRRRSR